MLKKIKRIFGDHLYLFGIIFNTEKRYLVAVLFYIILNYASPFVLIIPPKYILDGLIEGKSAMEILPMIIAMVGVYFVINILIKGIIVVKSNLELRLKVHLNVALSDKCMTIDYSEFESNETINIVNSARIAINGGLTYAQSIGLSGSQGIGGYFTQLCDLVTNMLKIITTLYILQKLKLWVIFIIIIGVIINVICGYVKKRTNVVLRNYAAPFLRKNQYCNRVLRSVEAGKDIRLYDLENYLLDKFSECNDKYIEAKNKYCKRLIMADIISACCNGGVTFMVFFSLILLLYANSITVGEFTLISGAVTGLFSYGIAMVSECMDLDIHSIYMQDYRKFMSYKSRIKSVGKKVTPGAHAIRFENVSFFYTNSHKKALDSINITINSGETVSIVGMNGAGKSTFVKLLTGLYKPTEGTIYIDNIPIDEFDHDSLTDYISVIFQDFNIYSMTVEENVTFSDNSDNDKIVKSLEEGGILKRINEMDDGIKTPIKDSFQNTGESLSGGEEQKLALARIFYKNSDLLILDEPTAALDAKAECEMYNNILKYIHGQTVLFVSHRMASSKFCDRILVFENGKIVEDGNHFNLVKLNGLYTKMWDAQSKYYDNMEGNMT